MEKNKKRIRHPKKVQQEEQKKHFVLDVQDAVISSKSQVGK